MPTIAPALAAGDTPGFSQSFDDKDVGTGKTLTPAGTVGDGNGGNNYTITFAPVTTGTITAGTVVPHVTAADKAYDTTTAATILTRTLTGVAGGDDVSLVGGTATFGDKTAADGKTVTAVGLSLAGADADNYSLSSTSATTTADITRRPLHVTATGLDRVYDGTTLATVTLSDDHLAGDVVTESHAATSFADEHAGTDKAIPVTGIAISGADAANYTLVNTTAAATADITPRPITVTAAPSTKVYDGTTSSTGIPTITVGSLATGDTPRLGRRRSTRRTSAPGRR